MGNRKRKRKKNRRSNKVPSSNKDPLQSFNDGDVNLDGLEGNDDIESNEMMIPPGKNKNKKTRLKLKSYFPTPKLVRVLLVDKRGKKSTERENFLRKQG